MVSQCSATSGSRVLKQGGASRILLPCVADLLAICALCALLFIASCDRVKPKGDASLLPRKGVTVKITGSLILEDAQQDTLLALARQAIGYALSVASDLPVQPSAESGLQKKLGCIVQLLIDGKVRGSGGYVLPVKELSSSVAELAMRAALTGGEAQPLKKEELGRTIIKITVVGEPEPLSADDALQVGKQGLVLMSREGQVKWILMPEDVGRLTAAPAAIDSILSAGQSSRNALKKGDVSLVTFTTQTFEETPRLR